MVLASVTGPRSLAHAGGGIQAVGEIPKMQLEATSEASLGWDEDQSVAPFPQVHRELHKQIVRQMVLGASCVMSGVLLRE